MAEPTTYSSEYWNFKTKTRFVFSYFSSKLALFSEIRKPKLKFIGYEIRYSLTNLINSIHPGLLPQALYYGPDEVETSKVRYKIRPGTHDAAIISPAFERSDKEELIKRIHHELRQNQSVGFLDVGANIGAFSVPIAKEFSNSKLKIWAFEPIPSNREILLTNLNLNGLKNVEVLPHALGNKSGTVEIAFMKTRPGDSKFTDPFNSSEETLQVSVRKADELLTDPPDILFIKIDVEGQEQQVLEGMSNLLTKPRRIWLCIEDIFHRESLWTFLKTHGFSFLSKSTPYNSWWISDSK